MAAPVANQNLLVNKSEHIGFVRALEPDKTLMWPRLAPLKDVSSDRFMWDIAQPDIYSLAPARAEGAESELRERDHFMGRASASIHDWALKDFYTASDITRYRETAYLRNSATKVPASYEADAQEFRRMIAKDAANRRASLDNRMEKIVVDSLINGTFSYDDGNMKMDIDWGRPAAQTDAAVAVDWDIADGSHDPLRDIIANLDYMYDTYKIKMGTLILSTKAARYLVKSTKFFMTTNNAKLGSGGTIAPTDIQYLIGNFGVDAVTSIISGATGLNVVIYDAAVWDRALGSNADAQWLRFMPEEKAVLLPDTATAGQLLGTEIGFAKTMTSPHPEGNWTSGFYAYEEEHTDPWGYSVGTGIKALPIFPAMELSMTMELWTP